MEYIKIEIGLTTARAQLGHSALKTGVGPPEKNVLKNPLKIRYFLHNF